MNEKQAHECIHAIDIAMLLKDVQDNSADQKELLKILNGNGKKGLVARVVHNEWLLKKSGWFLCVVISIITGCYLKGIL